MNGFRHVVAKLSRWFALAGGSLLAAMATLVVISVLGRVLIGRPVPGDFEIVATGTAISVFLCLPWCQLQRGNLIVDLFLARLSPRVVAWLDLLSAALLGLLALLFAWRMALGWRDAIAYQDVSVILGFPLWWAYPFAVGSFLLLACACVVTATRGVERQST
ncbi:MAG: TRAP transporter small permease subunit [Gammaproteobacteria bacterium]|nr:TRAP transporter small permease subunit [Gammaproteobacteria bacterium]